jgi:hypothetical protein
VKVIISDAAVMAAIDTEDVLKLHELIGFVRESKRHFLAFESADGIDRILSTFTSEVALIYRRLLNRSVLAASTFPAARATVRIDPVEVSLWDLPIPSLSLDDAIRLLGEKLVILVENANNDWNFLRGMMTIRERKLLQDYVDSGWAEPMHGGGDTLGALLEARLADPRKALRTFVLFDSDRLHPDEFDPNWTTERPGRNPVSCHAYGWERQIKNNGVKPRYWMLNRRFIESYMPKDELQKSAEKKAHPDALGAFFSMERDARWFYNMKAGLDKDQERNDKERCRDLYQSLSADMRTALARGFGNTLARHYVCSLEYEFDWDEEARDEAAQALPQLLHML